MIKFSEENKVMLMGKKKKKKDITAVYHWQMIPKKKKNKKHWGFNLLLLISLSNKIIFHTQKNEHTLDTINLSLILIRR